MSDLNKTNRLRRTIIWCLIAAFAIGVGCRDSTPPPSPVNELTKAERENAAGTLRLASRGGDWRRAWKATVILLEERSLSQETGRPIAASEATAISSTPAPEPLTPMTWSLMASAAHESGRAKAAAHFLACACRADKFANTPGVERTMVAMIEAGMLTDGMRFLEEALSAKPGEQNIRRLLFDLYMGSEDRVSAMPLAEELVIARKFDIPLLVAIANTERRTDDPEPLKVVASRNPEDRRPLLGVAKVKFDLGEFEEAIDELTSILKSHPDYQPAQALLGQAFSASGRANELEAWAGQQADGIQRYPAYWIALGDWAREKQQIEAAVRCFLEATNTVDPDGQQVWTRLATLIPQLEESSSLDEDVVQSVQNRAKLLARLSTLQDRFGRTGSISREIARDIASTLESLGRLWEAEAWLAVGMTLPEDDAVELEAARANVSKRLRRDMPWQSTEGHPECQIDPLAFPLPKIEQVVRNVARDPRLADSSQSNMPQDKLMTHWKMEDRAESRGLQFFGRTGDNLDQPGVMLFQTLGCGGGTIDFDRDGWPDLYLAAAGGTPPEQDSAPNALFRNLGGRFVNIGGEASVQDHGFGQGIAVGDINEDGFADLLVLNYGPNRLFLNRGDGTFGDARLLPSEPYD
ncbi:MAG: FG-GAP-like repeat-containing protein, partial [Planctomycetota bacterium]